MVLAFIIVVASDKHNLAPPHGLLPLVIFIVLLGLGVAFGMQTCKYHIVYRSQVLEILIFFKRLPLIPPVISAHAFSLRLRATERKYLRTEGNCNDLNPWTARADRTFFFSQYWLWCPIIAPFIGAQIGIGFYDLFLKQRESADSA
jgi:aquaglyceroporin related protein, other eukaryote